MTYFHFDRTLPVLRRNPVLTALVVYSVGICMAVAIAALAVWRETSTDPIARRFDHALTPQTAAPARQILQNIGALI